MRKLYFRIPGQGAAHCAIVEYEEQNHVVALTWYHSPTLDLMKQALNELLKVVHFYRCRRVIIDLRGVSDLLPGGDWCCQEWAPRANAEGISDLVVIRPCHVLAQLSVNIMARGVSPLIQVHIFQSPVSARNWFSKKTPLVA